MIVSIMTDFGPVNLTPDFVDGANAAYKTGWKPGVYGSRPPWFDSGFEVASELARAAYEAGARLKTIKRFPA